MEVHARRKALHDVVVVVLCIRVKWLAHVVSVYVYGTTWLAMAPCGLNLCVWRDGDAT